MCVGLCVRMQVPSEARVVRSTDVVNCLTWMLGMNVGPKPTCNSCASLHHSHTLDCVPFSVILRDCLPFILAHRFSPSSTELCPAQCALAFTGSGLPLHSPLPLQVDCPSLLSPNPAGHCHLLHKACPDFPQPRGGAFLMNIVCFSLMFFN